MTEPENFLERWSRRKRAAAAEASSLKTDAPVPQEQTDAPPPGADKPSDVAAGLPFDPASLPSIESIGAETDVSAFLRPGVPPDLARAALRRAWSSDPAIRDFVGLVENGWDFNDPNAVPGFGALSPGDVARLLSQAVGELAPEASKLSVATSRVAASRGDSEQNSPSEIVSSEPSRQSVQDQPALKRDAAVQSTDVQRNEVGASQDEAKNKGPLPTR
jgi:hypothetical protein